MGCSGAFLFPKLGGAEFMDAGKAEAQEHVFLSRASRASRGKRMTKLLDDEVEEDELFWNQDALKEDEVDEESAEATRTPLPTIQATTTGLFPPSITAAKTQTTAAQIYLIEIRIILSIHCQMAGWRTEYHRLI